MDSSQTARPSIPDPSWARLRSVSARGTRISLDVADPCDVRLSIDLGFSTIEAIGVDQVGDLIEGFQLRDEERIACERYGFVLSEQDEDGVRRVVYRDKHTEVRIPRSDYDRIAASVSEIVADPRVQVAFERAYSRHAAALRGEAWHLPGT
ncbi:hypothetical protein LNAOJCKE_4931 [Methylorubrum aminovorans]|uniref:Uncharacterized protein n=1 Tax=Methylorubrum aminovorans TaxID=269069 RepID=A0ABQ4UKL5_9HYPH|nr:hypothetical protein LNAOJCKE_4931 [Methylorubrum aminovorans]GMA79853.1 hypothetical protein GCM10025880_62700 [Methylorubrum aminovorans]GMA80012.1 hypothetical protein GCM10025880_64290 [Methylorubrum aminovorans]